MRWASTLVISITCLSLFGIAAEATFAPSRHEEVAPRAQISVSAMQQTYKNLDALPETELPLP